MRPTVLSTAALAALLSPAIAAPAAPVPAPQCPGVEDALEPNDTCQQRMAIALGSMGGLYVERGDADWFEVSIPDGERLVVECAYAPPFAFSPGIGIELRDPSVSCDFVAAAQLALEVNPVATGTRLVWSNLSGAARTVAVGIFVTDNSPQDCFTYNLSLATSPDACAGMPPDALEPNDGCGTAAPLVPGTYTGLTVALEDADVHAVVVPAGQRLSVDVAANPGFQDEALVLWSDPANCIEYQASEALTSSGSGGAVQSLSWLNDGPLTRTVLLEIRHPRYGAPPFCNDYDMLVRVSADPCFLEDVLEDNDSCGVAKPVADGTYPALRIRPEDPDFYRVRIQPGATFRAQLDFDSSEGDVNASLVAPGLHPCVFDPFGPRLDLAFGVGDIEVIEYTNPGPSVLDAVLIAVMSTGAGGQGNVCMQYDMEVTGSAIIETPIGRAYCSPAVNGAGTQAFLGVDRVPVVDDAQLTFEVGGLPVGAFGHLVMSPRAASSPIPVGAGRLCMGAPYYRILPTLSAADPAGDSAMNLPWGGLPVPIVAGSTWSFQHWYRDIAPGGAATSNFSSAIELAFQL